MRNELICKAWTLCCEDYANGGWISEGATEAAEFFVKETEAGGEYTPTPLLVNLFKFFYGGFVQGFELGEHVSKKRKAQLCNGIDERPSTEARRASAERLAELTGQATVYDLDAAAVIYNAVMEEHPGYPFEFLLGSVYYAGTIRGVQRERKRRKKFA